MTTEYCRFCDIPTNPLDHILHESAYCYVRCDLFPVTPKHMEIVPKRHVLSLIDLTKEEWLDIFLCAQIAQKKAIDYDFKSVYSALLNRKEAENHWGFLKKAIDSKFINSKPDAFTIGINDGLAAGRSVQHFHMHIIPRYWGDVKEPKGGIRAIFGEGSY